MVGTNEKMTIAEATELLTVAEVEAIERHAGKSFNEMSGISLTAGLVWAHERRRLQGDPLRPDWAQVQEWTLRALGDYFEPEPVEVTESEPESPVGKGV